MGYSIEEAAAALTLAPEDLQDIFWAFFEEATETLERCESAIHRGDFALLEELFHDLKGSASNLRMEQVRELAYRSELSAKEENMEKIQKDLAKLLFEVERHKEQVQHYYER
ncbi:Hpt domain-containing protein [Heliobacterium chlorum]|uniref:Hpt domain-containing protein n=1 Tax=Heliobacterium chlorum TaxID=2698 RepID=A0ABR7T4V6_HELCL|nr:Hpt domain-containing protein [Heliobacterium chlorum]MBC9784960.1 Hpt domain-containing protein [Heliobacterium chlorum]